MPRFRKKPVVIEAVQYVEYGKLVKGMCNSQSCFTTRNDKPHVHTIHDGQMVNLEIGDYVIPEPDGVHYYPCKPDIFEKSYEPMPHLVMVCGIDCHPGDRVCNNYCNMAPQKGPMVDMPPPGPDAKRILCQVAATPLVGGESATDGPGDAGGK